MHAMRVLYFHKQDGLCWLCGEPLDLFLPVHSFGSASWEHIIPRSGGGSKGWENVALTHWECNKLRRDQFIWRLERPKDRRALKRSHGQYLQRQFHHQVLNRLRPLLEGRRCTQ